VDRGHGKKADSGGDGSSRGGGTMTNEEIFEVLEEISAYLDNYADASHNGENYVPNKEMRLTLKLDDVIRALRNWEL
jgi:hypothetical protein